MDLEKIEGLVKIIEDSSLNEFTYKAVSYTHLGGINCGVEVFDRADSTEEFQAMFSVRGKALYTKMDFLFKMIGEILNSSKLEDTKRLYEIVASVKSRAQVNLTGACLLYTSYIY